MIHFQTRDHIIDWLIDNCPRPAIVRALEQGKVEFLGGFTPIPPSTLPGWIIKVKSIFAVIGFTAYNREWYIAILANDITHCYEIRIIKTVPWRNWIGTDSKSELFCGDNPLLYKELRDDRIS